MLNRLHGLYFMKTYVLLQKLGPTIWCSRLSPAFPRPISLKFAHKMWPRFQQPQLYICCCCCCCVFSWQIQPCICLYVRGDYTTLFNFMVVFHFIFSIWHGPPLSYLHGNKWPQYKQCIGLICIVRIFWIVFVISMMVLLWIAIIGDDNGMNSVSCEYSWDEQ